MDSDVTTMERRCAGMVVPYLGIDVPALIAASQECGITMLILDDEPWRWFITPDDPCYADILAIDMVADSGPFALFFERVHGDVCCAVYSLHSDHLPEDLLVGLREGRWTPDA
jgi:hypothetical protein